MDEPALELTGVSKSFLVPHARRSRLKEYFAHPLDSRGHDRNDALRDISLTVPRGEFLSVIGRNGSGKSTLLKVMAGIYRPDAGTVRVNGVLSPFIELGVGFNMELSARDNIQINGTLVGLTRREIADRLDEILEFAELERFVDQHLKNFSSGMLLRLGYAIAVQVPFDTLLVDEVLSVGDVDFQEKCFATFEQMRAAGKTIVFVSHGLDAVRSFSDRVILVEQGVLTATGPPDEIIDLYLAHVQTRESAEPAVYEGRASL